MVEYPKAVYHAVLGCRVVLSPEEQRALGLDWAESPAACPEHPADLAREPESPKGELLDAPEPTADVDLAPRKRGKK